MRALVSLGVPGLLIVFAALAYQAPSRVEAAAEGHNKDAVVDARGNLRVPGHYRASYQFLGTWAIAADKGVQGSKQIHDVYASPGAIAAYRKEGHFPDGTVLVKEVHQTATQSMTTGTVSHEDKLAGWFVMVKESKNLHPENKLWGDGWAWSWFDAGNPLKTTSTDYKKDCLACHVPAKSTDWIYVQGYPPLKADSSD